MLAVEITASVFDEAPAVTMDCPSGVTATKIGIDTPAEKAVPALKVAVSIGVIVLSLAFST